MTIKPLAYINVEERKLEWAEPITWHTPTVAKMDKIPLYTHPVKELTDDEIFEAVQDIFVHGKDEDILEFGRAILRKAQEK
jgi:hypothetical protein